MSQHTVALGNERIYHENPKSTELWVTQLVLPVAPEERLPYGRLGELTRDEWESDLHSDQGLFLKTRQALPPRILGPALAPTGKITGETYTFEEGFFGEVSTPEQLSYHDELVEAIANGNKSAALEYMLVISGAERVWRKDMHQLQLALAYLEQEKDELREDVHLLHSNGVPYQNIIGSLTRHYPDLFGNIDLEVLTRREVCRLIKSTLTRSVIPKERTLRHYLATVQEEIPFLFRESKE